MKRFFTLFVFFLSIACSYRSVAQGWKWASGCTGGAEGYGSAVDEWGDVYASGFAGGTLKFPGVTISGFGICGVVVVKYDPSGNFLWVKGTRYAFAKPISLAIDRNDNVYVYGYYTTDSLGIDSITLHNPDSASMLFLAKYTPSGSLVWAENICPGNGPGNITVHSNSIYLTAAIDDTAVSIGPYTLHNGSPGGVTTDIAFARFDLSGNVISAVSYGSMGDEVAYVSVTPTGKIYLAGTSSSPSVTLGAITLVNADSSLILARLDSAGNVIWARNEPGIGKFGSWVSGVATDSAEDAFVCGTWRPKAYLGTQILQADTVCEVFLVKYDSAGNIGFVSRVTGNGQIGADAVVTDNCGNVWVAGGLGDQIPGHHGSNYIEIGAVHIDTPLESSDPMFLAEWTTGGTFVKAAVLPTCGDDEISIGASAAGDIFVCADYWMGPYHIAGSFLYDPVQPSENIVVVKYLNNTSDSTITRSLVCISDSVVLRAPPGYPYYRWADGRIDTAITVYAPGTYRLYGTGRCGSGILEAVFVVDTGKKDTTYGYIDTTICLHAHSILHAPAGYSPYLWTNGDTTQVDTISAAGIYWVVASGTCSIPSVIDTFNVTDTTVDLAFSLGNDTAVCGPILLAAPLTGYNYLWEDGTTASTDWATQTGLYYLTISVLSCYNSDSVEITFPNLSQHLQDTILCRENPVQVKLVANVPQGASALWSTGGSADSIWVNTAGTYWVTVSQDDCSGSDTMTLAITMCTCDAIMPAAFTPNGDGKNDTYGPILDKRCDVFDYSFCVYNRWGNLVYSSHDPADRWDGKYYGVPQDVGTFMYCLQYCTGSVFNKHVEKGDLVLVR